MGIRDLPTLADMNRHPRPVPKGTSRLQQTKTEATLTVVDAKAFKAEVWKRDKGLCRCCRRKVQKVIERVPDRGEVHHIHGRVGPYRFESRCALLVCCRCHEELTGRVACKVICVGTSFVQIDGQRCIDARKPVVFKRVA